MEKNLYGKKFHQGMTLLDWEMLKLIQEVTAAHSTLREVTNKKKYTLYQVVNGTGFIWPNSLRTVEMLSY